MSFVLFLFLILAFVTCRSIQHAVFSVLSSADKFGSIPFSFFVSDYFWVLYNRTGNTQDSRMSFFISSFWNFSANTNTRLLNMIRATEMLFLISYPVLSRMISVVLGMCILGLIQEFVLPVWFLFQCCLPLLWYFLRSFVIQHLCSRLLVRSSFFYSSLL